MDLKDCPQCDTFMSETYENHPQCGDVVNHKQTIPQPPPPPPFTPPQYQHVNVVVPPKKDGCFMQTLNVGCIVVVIIFVLLILYAVLSGAGTIILINDLLNGF